MTGWDYRQHGLALQSSVFTLSEIHQLRQLVRLQLRLDDKRLRDVPVTGFKVGFQDTHSPTVHAYSDLATKPYLRWLITEPRILNMARSCLGPGPLIYFGDSGYQVGQGGYGWHRDNIDRQHAEGPDWEGDYPLIRVGLYLQDHSWHSGGLKVQVGSHRAESGKPVMVDTEAGDLVAWNLRILHSGNAVRLRGFSKWAIQPHRHLRKGQLGERAIPLWLRRPEAQERMALFLTYGQPGTHLDRYLEHYFRRPDVRQTLMTL